MSVRVTPFIPDGPERRHRLVAVERSGAPVSSVRMLLRGLLISSVSALLAVPAPAAAEPAPVDLTARIDAASIALERVVESYNRLSEKIRANRAAVTRLEKRIGPLERQLGQSHAEVGELAATAYRIGRLGTANALLGAGGSTALLDRLGSLDQLARERQRQLAGFGLDRRRLLDEKVRLDVTLARQAAQSRELAAGRKRIEADLRRLYELRRQAFGSATSEGEAHSGTVPPVAGDAGVAVRYAYAAIGKPYRWGAEGPGGYDCSGLTLAAWRAAGRSLPHNAAMQWSRVTQISRSALRPGDLVFYRNLGHVALFVGSGRVIHAPTFGENVRLARIDMMRPYGYGRVR